MPAIDLEKGRDESEECRQEENTQAMQGAINDFFNHLVVKHDVFSNERAFDELQRYIIQYDRILYSPISNIIYSAYENSQEEELIGTLMSNLDALVSYSLDSDVIAKRKIALKEDTSKRIVDDTKKSCFEDMGSRKSCKSTI